MIHIVWSSMWILLGDHLFLRLYRLSRGERGEADVKIEGADRARGSRV